MEGAQTQRVSRGWKDQGPVIQFQDIHVTYPGDVTALRGVTLTIEQGEFVVVLGPTGSGKSSMLKLLHRALKPTSGSVKVVGQDLSHLSRASVPVLRRGIGFIQPAPKLLVELSLLENAAMPLRLAGEPRAVAKRKALEALADVGLDGRGDLPVMQATPGERQLCCVARALVTAPSIVLADAPTACVDPATAERIAGILRDVHLRGMTVVMTAQDEAQLNREYQRVVVLEAGQVVSDTPAKTFGGLKSLDATRAQVRKSLDVHLDLPLFEGEGKASEAEASEDAEEDDPGAEPEAAAAEDAATESAAPEDDDPQAEEAAQDDAA